MAWATCSWACAPACPAAWAPAWPACAAACSAPTGAGPGAGPVGCGAAVFKLVTSTWRASSMPFSPTCSFIWLAASLSSSSSSSSSLIFLTSLLANVLAFAMPYITPSRATSPMPSSIAAAPSSSASRATELVSGRIT